MTPSSPGSKAIKTTIGNLMGSKKRRYPKDVYVYRNKLVYWPYLGCVDGKAKRGKRILLGEITMPEGAIYQALEQIKESKVKTLEWLLSWFIASPEFKKRGKKTQNEQKDMYYPRIISAKSPKTGKALGDAPLEHITPAMLKRFLDTQTGNSTKNKIKSFIGKAWSTAVMEFDDIPRISPTEQIARFEEESRERYVTDEEYRKARRLMKPIYRAAMEIAFQCRARGIEICNLTHDDILEEGLYIKRTKGSLPEITLWNRRLECAVNMAIKLNKTPDSPFLFPDKDGSRLTEKKFSSRFRDIMRRLVESGKLTREERFTFHDMKAKGVSDHEEQYSGHKTKKGKKIYIRKAPKVKGSKA